MKAYTDLEQSKKLAEILPLESADNVIVSFGGREGVTTVVMPNKTFEVIKTPFSDIRELVPCWSLAALMNVLDRGALFITPQGWACQSYINFKAITSSYYDNPVDSCYEMIIKLHEQKLL